MERQLGGGGGGKASASAGFGGATFGARGFIASGQRSFFDKQVEFRAWLAEVKGISPDTPMPKSDQLEHFKDYVEAYNTASLPHDKFYDMDAWDKRVAAGEADEGRKGDVGRFIDAEDDGAGAFNMVAEAAARRAQAAAAAAAAQQATTAALLAGIDRQRLAGLARQQELQAALQHAHKTGDQREVARLTRLLKPEDK